MDCGNTGALSPEPGIMVTAGQNPLGKTLHQCGRPTVVYVLGLLALYSWILVCPAASEPLSAWESR
jgi:hypothetical protein